MKSERAKRRPGALESVDEGAPRPREESDRTYARRAPQEPALEELSVQIKRIKHQLEAYQTQAIELGRELEQEDQKGGDMPETAYTKLRKEHLDLYLSSTATLQELHLSVESERTLKLRLDDLRRHVFFLEDRNRNSIVDERPLVSENAVYEALREENMRYASRIHKLEDEQRNLNAEIEALNLDIFEMKSTGGVPLQRTPTWIDILKCPVRAPKAQVTSLARPAQSAKQLRFSLMWNIASKLPNVVALLITKNSLEIKRFTHRARSLVSRTSDFTKLFVDVNARPWLENQIAVKHGKGKEFQLCDYGTLQFQDHKGLVFDASLLCVLLPWDEKSMREAIMAVIEPLVDPGPIMRGSNGMRGLTRQTGSDQEAASDLFSEGDSLTAFDSVSNGTSG